MDLVYYVRIYLSSLLFIAFDIHLSKSLGFTNFQCTQKGPCRCVGQDDKGIDLSPLNNITTIKFLTAVTKEVIYFYHPCSNEPLITKNRNQTECEHGSALCLYQANNHTNTILDVNNVLNSSASDGNFTMLARAEDGQFMVSQITNQVQILYKNGAKNNVVKLVCKSEPSAVTSLKFENENATNYDNNILILESNYSCIRDLSSDHSKHMSGASVFFLILACVAALYFFGGMLILRFIRGATGKEMIPNYEFWTNFPSLVKDCFLFVASCGRRTPDSYERI